jgi:predicted Zn-dependent peptidase
MVNAKASIAGVCEQLANYHVYFKDTDLINTEIDRYMKVTKEDIQRVAKQYFTKDNRVCLYYMPKNKKQ